MSEQLARAAQKSGDAYYEDLANMSVFFKDMRAELDRNKAVYNVAAAILIGSNQLGEAAEISFQKFLVEALDSYGSLYRESWMKNYAISYLKGLVAKRGGSLNISTLRLSGGSWEDELIFNIVCKLYDLTGDIDMGTVKKELSYIMVREKIDLSGNAVLVLNNDTFKVMETLTHRRAEMLEKNEIAMWIETHKATADGVGKIATGIAIIGFGAAAKSLSNTKVDIPNASELKNSQTVQNHMNDLVKKGQYKGELSRPYIDSNGTRMLLDEIMNSSAPVQDSAISTALRWDVPGVFRGTTGTWELVVDTSTNTILHFLFN